MVHQKKYESGFRRARVARISRVLLPVTAVALLAAAFIWSPHDLTEKFSLPIERERILAEGLRISSPTFRGTMPTGEAYRIHAEWALPSGVDTEKVNLHNVEGTLILKDQNTATLYAGQAFAKTQEKLILFDDGVRITTSHGYELMTQTATVNGKENTIISDVEVTLKSQTGTLNAGNMKVIRDIEADNTIAYFGGSGGVNITFTPSIARNKDE